MVCEFADVRCPVSVRLFFQNVSKFPPFIFFVFLRIVQNPFSVSLKNVRELDVFVLLEHNVGNRLLNPLPQIRRHHLRNNIPAALGDKAVVRTEAAVLGNGGNCFPQLFMDAVSKSVTVNFALHGI